MIECVLPPSVTSATRSPDLPPDRLFPEEEPAVARAVPRRHRDFALGRTCARDALRRLGAPAGAIPVRPDRSPGWPDRVVGSITHCDRLAAAAVAWASDFSALGIDAELASALEEGLRSMICTERERHWQDLRPPPPRSDWTKLAFSAKESVHKAVAPSSGVFLSFHDVEVEFDLDGAFRLRHVGVPDQRLPDMNRMVGRWAVVSGLVLTAAYLPVSGNPSSDL